MRTPKEIVAYANKAALEKEKYSLKKGLTLSFMAGAYISMGGLLSVLMGYGFPGIAAENPGIIKLFMGAAFPIGLIMIVLAGGELFTGNCAYFIPNIMNGRQAWKVAFRNWAMVWSGNFIGALFFAVFMVYLTGISHYEPWKEGFMSIAIAKTSNPFVVTFLKGIGANWLVCLAMWLGMSAKDTVGKIFGIWGPVMTFVAIGFEHSIANMFFIPLAMFEGASITITDLFIKNLIPATLGNIVGGAVFIGMLYWYVYDSKEKSTETVKVAEKELV
ncbi:MAG: formate/nitrite transporter family protein [Marinifilaceae bacterium]